MHCIRWAAAAAPPTASSDQELKPAALAWGVVVVLSFASFCLLGSTRPRQLGGPSERMSDALRPVPIVHTHPIAPPCLLLACAAAAAPAKALRARRGPRFESAHVARKGVKRDGTQLVQSTHGPTAFHTRTFTGIGGGNRIAVRGEADRSERGGRRSSHSSAEGLAAGGPR